MQIIHFIDEFIFELFGLPDANLDKLKQAASEFYTIDGIAPTIAIRDGLLIVEPNISGTRSSESDFDRAVEFCNAGQSNKAKPLLEQFLKKNPAHSEANRVLGQIFSEEGNQEKAQDYLIEALKWNPKNHWALVMMGNILSNYAKDIPSSQKYFEQARKINPQDFLVLNNIGGNLLKLGKTEEAKTAFWEAMKIKDDYPNTHYALALIAHDEGDFDSGFFSAIKAIKHARPKEPIYEQALLLSTQIAARIASHRGGVYKLYAQELRDKYRVNIAFQEDDAINSPAILQLSELHGGKQHVIRFRQSSATHEHWILHELILLKFILQARIENKNILFATDVETAGNFRKKIAAEIPEPIFEALFVGLNQQIYNTPAALFAEHEIYRDFPEARPQQYLSLYNDLREAIAASVDTRIREMTPAIVGSVNRIYNLLKAFQFKELYGVDLVADSQATNAEIRQAHDMFREFTEYRDEKQPADEYKLLRQWAQHLRIDDIFKLVPESMTNTAPESMDAGHQAAQMEQFKQSAAETGFNMAVVMYMVDALEHFSQMPIEAVKKAALEIAMLGTRGIDPNKKGYRVNAVPDKSFSGYHLLAYYYVTFALALPEMLSQLGLPYDGEYAMAKTMAQR